MSKQTKDNKSILLQVKSNEEMIEQINRLLKSDNVGDILLAAYVVIITNNTSNIIDRDRNYFKEILNIDDATLHKLMQYELMELNEKVNARLREFTEELFNTRWLLNKYVLDLLEAAIKLTESATTEESINKKELAETKVETEETLKKEKENETVDSSIETKKVQELPVFTCIDKIKGSGNKIIAYIMQDEVGNTQEVKPEVLKQVMLNKTANITNLKITSGKIVNKK